MSLAPKIDELQVLKIDLDLGFTTETWVKDKKLNYAIQINDLNKLIKRKRARLKLFKCERYMYIPNENDYEVLRALVRSAINPRCLPRRFAKLIVA